MGNTVAYDLKVFRSFDELLKYLDGEIARLTDRLNKLSGYYTRLKEKAERIRQLEEAISKIVGESPPPIREIDLMGVKVVVDARAIDEMKVLEEVLTSTEDVLNAMKKARKVLEPLAKSLSTPRGGLEGIDILVETLNGIPIRVLLRERT
ncbi:MAG: hypothetical protein DRJ69_01210 [Thermoprotei archaeon]|nr:MAG: hypothetical protein DRJ69_01210 [Thermoprotei archaeon]